MHRLLSLLPPARLPSDRETLTAGARLAAGASRSQPLAKTQFGVEISSDGITDENDDGYDDVSYEIGYENGATSGDLNLDGIGNVLDVVTLVKQILGN